MRTVNPLFLFPLSFLSPRLFPPTPSKPVPDLFIDYVHRNMINLATLPANHLGKLKSLKFDFVEYKVSLVRTSIAKFHRPTTCWLAICMKECKSCATTNTVSSRISKDLNALYAVLMKFLWQLNRKPPTSLKSAWRITTLSPFKRNTCLNCSLLILIQDPFPISTNYILDLNKALYILLKACINIR